MKQALELPTNTLRAGFNELFKDVWVITLPKKLADGEAEVGVILIRVDGDPTERLEMFVETDGDKYMQKVVEACLGMGIGTLLSYIL